MRIVICLFVLISFDVAIVSAGNGTAIVAAARSQIGIPYSLGGGGYQGKSRGINQGANIEGFDW